MNKLITILLLICCIGCEAKKSSQPEPEKTLAEKYESVSGSIVDVQFKLDYNSTYECQVFIEFEDKFVRLVHRNWAYGDPLILPKEKHITIYYDRYNRIQKIEVDEEDVQ